MPPEVDSLLIASQPGVVDTHVGVGTGTSIPLDRLGRQDEARTEVTPFLDPSEVLEYDWKKEAVAALERLRKKLKFPTYTREGACSGELNLSSQCWFRRYDPKGANTYYTLLADAARQETLLCVRNRFADCMVYDKGW